MPKPKKVLDVQTANEAPVGHIQPNKGGRPAKDGKRVSMKLSYDAYSKLVELSAHLTLKEGRAMTLTETVETIIKERQMRQLRKPRDDE